MRHRVFTPDLPKLVFEIIASKDSIHFITQQSNTQTLTKIQLSNNNTDSHTIHMTCNNKLFVLQILLGCQFEGGLHCCNISCWDVSSKVVIVGCWEGSCGLLSIVYNAKGGLRCWEVVVVCCIFTCQADDDLRSKLHQKGDVCHISLMCGAKIHWHFDVTILMNGKDSVTMQRTIGKLFLFSLR